LDCANLKSYAPANKLYYQLLRFPQEIIPVMDFTVTKVFLDLFEDAEISAQGLVVRPFNLGRSVNMRELNPADIDQLITVKGLMIRSSPVIPDMKKAFFRCSVCEQTMTADIDRGRISEPTVCPGTACQSKNTMRLVHNRSEFSDKQVARMQETPGIFTLAHY
jgi:DNA replication licensing factor MCM4